MQIRTWDILPGPCFPAVDGFRAEPTAGDRIVSIPGPGGLVDPLLRFDVVQHDVLERDLPCCQLLTLKEGAGV